MHIRESAVAKASLLNTFEYANVSRHKKALTSCYYMIPVGAETTV